MDIKILGTSATVTSKIKFEDLEKLEYFTPAELTLKDEEKKPIFRISVGPSSINKNGIQFNNFNANGLAQCTIELPGNMTQESRTEFIQNNYGLPLYNLSKLEDQLEAKLTDLSNKFAAVAENTIVVD